MSSVFYFDPAKKYIAPDMPQYNHTIGYWRLLDCGEKQLQELRVGEYPASDYTIAEIYPPQIPFLPRPFDRLSIVLKKPDADITDDVRSLLPHCAIDITFLWKANVPMSEYLNAIEQFIETGVQHFSFYELTDFEQWTLLRQFMREKGFYFYDRFHACLPSHESVYQKHLAQYGDVYAWGGMSRVTDADGVTRIKKPHAKSWIILSAADATLEKLLFAMTDCDGIAPGEWRTILHDENIKHTCDAGLAVIDGNRLKPTAAGMWDNVGLVACLYDE